MPIYDFQCGKCEFVFEEWQSMMEQKGCRCPNCGGESRRLISQPAILFKGTGFYKTDSRKKVAGQGIE